MISETSDGTVIDDIPDYLVIEDSKMPTTPDGTPVDIIVNPGAVYNRLIPSTLYEHELNFTSDRLIQLINKQEYQNLHKEISDDRLKVLYYLNNFLSKVAHKQYISYMEMVSLLSDEDATQLWHEMVKHGFRINQSPFHGNVTPEALHEIYKFLEEEFANIGEELLYRIPGIHEPVIIADKYFVKLKHETITKLSARNAGNISTMKSIPHKNNLAFKRGLEWFSNNPVR